MRAYIKSVTETNVTLVDIEAGQRVTVPVTALQKLFGKTPEADEVWEFEARRLDDIAEWFKRWQVVQQA